MFFLLNQFFQRKMKESKATGIKGRKLYENKKLK